MPACVDACKEYKALVFGDLGDPKSEISELLRRTRPFGANHN